MGVETKFGIYDVVKDYDKDGNVTFDYGRTIAIVDCHKLGWAIDSVIDGFSNKEIDFSVYGSDGDTKLVESPYGGKYRYITDLKGLHKALSKKNKEEPYVNLTIFCDTLKTLLKQNCFKYSKEKDTFTQGERERFLAVVVFRY